jgi:sulfur-oxidizing protein SoxY
MNEQRRLVLKAGGSLGVLALAYAAGLIQPVAAVAADWNQSAFAGKSLDEVLAAFGGAAPTESKDIDITAPDIAENGAVVPIAASTALPGVKRLLFLVEKNPNTLAGWFDLSDAVEANVSTRIKMAETSRVYAVATTADNRVLFAQKQVKVTLGGCGG